MTRDGQIERTVRAMRTRNTKEQQRGDRAMTRWARCCFTVSHPEAPLDQIEQNFAKLMVRATRPTSNTIRPSPGIPATVLATRKAERKTKRKT